MLWVSKTGQIPAVELADAHLQKFDFLRFRLHDHRSIELCCFDVEVRVN